MDYLTEEPAEEYHAKRGEYLSSHLLKDFRKSPLLYYRKISGMIPDKDRPAFRIGRAAHTLILEGREKYESEYVVGGPINSSTGKPYGSRTKAYKEWAEEQSGEVLTHDQAELIENMNAGVERLDHVREILTGGIAEGVARTDYLGVACQIRCDYFSEAHGLVDLKTCDDLTWFESDAKRYQYPHQLAFYRSILAEVAGVNTDAIPVNLLAVEKKEPYRAGIWKVDPVALENAEAENRMAIEDLKRCRERDHWPTGYEEIRVFTG